MNHSLEDDSSGSPYLSPNAAKSRKMLENLRASGNALEVVLEILQFIKSKKIPSAKLAKSLTWTVDRRLETRCLSRSVQRRAWSRDLVTPAPLYGNDQTFWRCVSYDFFDHR